MMICLPLVALVLYGIVVPKIEIKLDKMAPNFYWIRKAIQLYNLAEFLGKRTTL